MKVDRYTQIVLSIIAMALVILVIQNTSFFPKAYATNKKGTLTTMDIKPTEVNITEIAGSKIQLQTKQDGITKTGYMPVQMQGE